MSDIYLAAPLFNAMERERNKVACELLEAYGFTVFLPQRDAGEIGKDVSETVCYGRDIDAIMACRTLIAFTNGAHVDEGTAFEIGFATALGKDIVIVNDDYRSFSMTQRHNNMFRQAIQVEYLNQWEPLAEKIGKKPDHYASLHPDQNVMGRKYV